MPRCSPDNVKLVDGVREATSKAKQELLRLAKEWNFPPYAVLDWLEESDQLLYILKKSLKFRKENNMTP